MYEVPEIYGGKNKEGNDTLQKFEEMETNSKVDDELARLKAEMGM